MQRCLYIAGGGLALFASLGCAGRTPEPGTGVEPDRTTPPVVREQPRTPATTPVGASFEYAAGIASYIVTTEATIAEIDSVASEPRAFREVAQVDVAIAPADGATLVTTTGSIEGTTSAGIIRPFVDTLRVVSTDSVAEPTLPICGRDTVPPMHLVTLLPPVPLELREGVRWQRRQVYAICQGPIPIRVERTDSYTVTGRAPKVAGTGVTLTRSSSFAYAGSGVDGQHNVRVTGSGSGQATIVLDTSKGRLVSAVEESVSEIDVTASGRTRRFSQRIARTVEPLR
ncbi:MAG: hypothetical protein WEA80_06635 [Gemmatimonadaceae bacterium]